MIVVTSVRRMGNIYSTMVMADIICKSQFTVLKGQEGELAHGIAETKLRAGKSRMKVWKDR
jgi:hypothetical protein